jgi:hypothetical protein
VPGRHLLLRAGQGQQAPGQAGREHYQHDCGDGEQAAGSGHEPTVREQVQRHEDEDERQQPDELDRRPYGWVGMLQGR